MTLKFIGTHAESPTPSTHSEVSWSALVEQLVRNGTIVVPAHQYISAVQPTQTGLKVFFETDFKRKDTNHG